MLPALTPALTHDMSPVVAMGSWLRNGGVRHGISLALFDYADKQSQIYNILFVLVFGFATLNILGLVARRFEPDRNRSRLSFGETIAVTVVVVSIVLLGWELLNMFKIFPIKLHSR